MSAARYYQRSPRYVFRPEDQSLMRFAEVDVKGITSRARVRDLSTTGLSFIVDSNEAPFVGDMLKVEFGVPGRKQIAWFATVVRVESQNEWDPELGQNQFTVVALQFRKLPEPFAKAIEKSLSTRATKDESPFDYQSANSQQLAFVALMSFGMAICFVLMTLSPEAWLRPFRALF